MSPFLFILAMEGLSRMTDKAKQFNWLEDLGIGDGSNTSTSVFHWLFADDTLTSSVVLRGERSQVQHLNFDNL